MLRRLLALVLPVVLLTAGCSDARDAASTVGDCAGLAADVASAGLDGVPTAEEAEAAVRRLDDRVQDLETPEVRDAAGALRDRLRELQEAARSADPDALRSTADRAREAGRAAAQACGIPVDRFLGA